MFELSKKPLHFNELARRLKGICSRVTLQRRLSKLVEAGILDVKVDGQYKFYTIKDRRLRMGLRLLSQLMTAVETILSSNVPNQVLKNEVVVLFTLVDMAWYYVWYNSMVDRNTGEILLLAAVKIYWPKIFRLVENFLTGKGVDIRRIPTSYIDELVAWIEWLKDQVITYQDIVHKREIGESLACLLEAYKSLTNMRSNEDSHGTSSHDKKSSKDKDNVEARAYNAPLRKF